MSDTIQFKLGMQKNPIDLKNPREGGWYKNKVEKVTLLAKKKWLAQSRNMYHITTNS